MAAQGEGEDRRREGAVSGYLSVLPLVMHFSLSSGLTHFCPVLQWAKLVSRMISVPFEGFLIDMDDMAKMLVCRRGTPDPSSILVTKTSPSGCSHSGICCMIRTWPFGHALQPASLVTLQPWIVTCRFRAGDPMARSTRLNTVTPLYASCFSVPGKRVSVNM